MKRNKFSVIEVRDSAGLEKARELREKGIYVFALIPGGYRPALEELEKSTNIFFKVNDDGEKIEKARNLITDSFRGERKILISFDELTDIGDAGRAGFIGFGKSAEGILSSGFSEGKKIKETASLMVSFITGGTIKLREINREMELLSSVIKEDSDIYFGHKTEKNKKEPEILVIGI